MRSLSRILATAALSSFLLATSALADDKTKAIEERLELAKKSLVTVELTARVPVERLPGLGEGGKGVVRTDPMAAAFALLGAHARADVEHVLVIGGLDSKPREASWVGRDDERGL